MQYTRLILVCFTSWIAATPALASDFGGNFFGELNGVPATLSLQQKGSSLRGALKIGSAEASRLRGTVEGNQAKGALANSKGSGGFEATLNGDNLAMLVRNSDPAAPKLSLQFRRAGADVKKP